MDGIFQYLSELLCSWNIKQSFDSSEWSEAQNQSPVLSRKIKNPGCPRIFSQGVKANESRNDIYLAEIRY